MIKKFPSPKDELFELSSKLAKEPEADIPLENDTYKLRIAIKSKGKGKSGGARVITYVITSNKEVYLLTIYDKSEFENIDDKVIKSILQSLD
ncbi:hypothetical protein ACI6Q2_14125 [Chitinophagaceae bacterium LWZ2-11]